VVFLSSYRQTPKSILKQTMKSFHVFSSSPQIVFSSHSILCTHTRARTHTCACAHTHTCMHTHTHAHTQARTRAHTHTHARACVWSLGFMYVSRGMAVFSFVNFYRKLNNKFLWTALFQWYFPSMTIVEHR